MIKNTVEQYGVVSKIFHWLMALLILFMFVVGFLLDKLKAPLLYDAHKAIGFILLLLAITRLSWKLINQVPSYNKTIPKRVALAAHLFHYFLYALMIAMPLSAFIGSNAEQRPVSFLLLFKMPLLFEHKNIQLAKTMMDIHKTLAIVFVIAISLHVLTALYHHFIRKDNILKRILP
jgi:cytochrome b561